MDHPSGRIATGDGSILVFDRAGSRAVDEAALRRYGLPGIVLMENAARAVADHAVDLLNRSNRGARGDGGAVLIVSGSGNNGGDGFAAARHLHNAGVHVTLRPIGLPRPGGDAAINFDVCRRMRIPEIDGRDDTAFERAALIIDAIFGTGLERAVSGEPAEAIVSINRSGVPVLSVDLPSGLDCDTGAPLGVAVRATRTVSLLGWKAGFRNSASRAFTGEVVVGHVGVPRELLEEFALRTT